MEQQPNKPPADTSLASVEAGLFVAWFGFQQKISTLLRGSSLDGEKGKLVVEQVMLLIDNAIAEMKRSNDMNVKGRLESVYEQAKRLVDDLAKTQG